MQGCCTRVGVCLQRGDCVQGFISDIELVEGVRGDIWRFRHHHRDRVPHIAHPVTLKRHLLGNDQVTELSHDGSTDNRHRL